MVGGYINTEKDSEEEREERGRITLRANEAEKFRTAEAETSPGVAVRPKVAIGY